MRRVHAMSGLAAVQRHRASKPPPTATAAEKLAQICTRIFGSSTEYDGVIALVFEIGWEEGYKEGLKEGSRTERRRAKGKPQYAKPHGGQKLLNDVWALQFFDFVEESTANGKISVPSAAAEYLLGWTHFLRKEGVNNHPCFQNKVFTLNPTEARAGLVRLYRRMKNGRDKIDPHTREQVATIKRFLSET